MIQQGSWRWSKIQAKQILKEELFSKKRTIGSYKILLSKYKTDNYTGIEGKIKICICKLLFKYMQRHYDKRIAKGETKEQILSN